MAVIKRPNPPDECGVPEKFYKYAIKDITLSGAGGGEHRVLFEVFCNGIKLTEMISSFHDATVEGVQEVIKLRIHNELTRLDLLRQLVGEMFEG
jgi:hypothetical protein